MAEVEKARMPFGKYGPDHYPPNGVPIYDVPYDYLEWFRRKGYPKGKLGEVMEFVRQIKLDGADSIFEPIRKRNHGRTRLRKPPQKQWSF